MGIGSEMITNPEDYEAGWQDALGELAEVLELSKEVPGVALALSHIRISQQLGSCDE